MPRPVAAEPFTRHALLRRIDALLCGEEGSTRACRIVLAGFLIGGFLMFHDALRVVWLAAVAPLAFLFVDWRRAWHSVRHDALRLVAAHFVCWMTARSLLGYGMTDGSEGMVASGWLLGTVLQVCFAAVVWHAAENAEALESLGRWVGFSAAFAAVVSIVMFYALLPGHVFGERLMNWFVYGGWNPVSTGLTFGFAALWLVCLGDKAGARSGSLLTMGAVALLLLAVCFTRSRGALLSLLAGFAVLTWMRGFRRMRLPWVLLAGAVIVFALSGPVVSRVAMWQAETRALRVEDRAVAQQAVEWMQNAPPAAELMQRGDSGRFDLYQRALRSFTGLEHWTFGLGQWGPEEACCRSLSKLQHHLHSAFLATLVHGGIIGLGLVLVVLGIGFRRAVSLARSGQDTWLVLLAYGCVGMVFDGQTFVSLTSIPQMETLLVAFPLVAASSAWWHQSGARRSVA